ncbi:glycosyltransferase [Marivirga sp.]|uniref:glycosyltransferase n=1 Tax=Marivirga sp. TaxID=2018662 RepID=UPI003DA714E7
MILLVTSYIIVAFFSVTVVYTAIFSIAGHFYKSKNFKNSNLNAKIAILIPAYKEDDVIVSVCHEMQQLNYPSERYTVFVIADQLQERTHKMLKELGVEVVPVTFKISTKAKSLNYCLGFIDENDYDLVLISDADNILSKNFLVKINNAFQNGLKVIQGRRVAKNMDSNYAVLDAASEIINNHIFRKGPNALNLSASLIGSGMAFSTTEIKNALNQIKAIGGFDKVLQLNVIESGNKIQYLDDAIIFDEKISDSGNFKNQRKRWLASQYIYLVKFFGKGLKNLFSGNFDYFNIAILHNLFLPRVLNLGVLFILTFIAYFLNWNEILNFQNILILFIAYFLTLVTILPIKFFDRKFAKAILSLPGAFLNMFLLLFKLKGADKTFIHTKHSKKDIDNSIYSVDENK